MPQKLLSPERLPLLPLALLFLALPARAQERTPELIGGMPSIQEHLHYPQLARQAGIEGRVLVQFMVEEDGTVQDAQVLRGVGSGLDEAALEAVRQARFRPGYKDGAPARMRMVLPITFVLPDGDDTSAEDGNDAEDVATQVDEMPEMEGGMGALAARLVYPEEAEREGLEGRVVVTFIVDETGAVQDAEIAEGAHPLLDEAALEAVRATPFRPGLRDGAPVRVRMALPVIFSLPETEG